MGYTIADDKRQSSRNTEEKSDQKYFIAHKTISQSISSFTSLNDCDTGITRQGNGQSGRL